MKSWRAEDEGLLEGVIASKLSISCLDGDPRMKHRWSRWSQRLRGEREEEGSEREENEKKREREIEIEIDRYIERERERGE